MQRHVLAYNHNVMLVRHHFLKGWRGTSHSHPREQLVYVVTGRIQFDGGGKTIELRSGDSVIVEGNVEHRATALEDSEVLDVFVPFREDYGPRPLGLLTWSGPRVLDETAIRASATRFAEAAASNKLKSLTDESFSLQFYLSAGIY